MNCLEEAKNKYANSLHAATTPVAALFAAQAQAAATIALAEELGKLHDYANLLAAAKQAHTWLTDDYMGGYGVQRAVDLLAPFLKGGER